MFWNRLITTGPFAPSLTSIERVSALVIAERSQEECAQPEKIHKIATADIFVM